MLRLPLVGGLQRCSRISLFCLHPHRTPQGFAINIIIITIDIIITVIIIIILSPLSLVSSRWSFENLYQWQPTFAGERVAGVRHDGPHQVGLHWWSSVVIGCYWLLLVVISH